jgi:hypothetical protein
VGLVILAVLALIGGLVTRSRLRAGAAVFGVGEAQAPGEAVSRWDRLELESAAGDGFRRSSAPQVYTSDTLYEKIDGKADFYISSGFNGLLTQRFVNKADEQLWMELFVYDMGLPENAFSVYSLQRRPGTENIDRQGVRYGYRTENGLYFAHGRIYVEMVGSSAARELRAAMERVAGFLVDSQAAGETARMEDADLFAGEGLIEDTVKLYLNDAFGFERFKGVYTAQYMLGSRPATAFLCRAGTAAEAAVLFEHYRQFLIENGANPVAVPAGELGSRRAEAFDFYGRIELVFAAGPFVAGARDCPDAAAAVRLAAMLAGNIDRGEGAENND